MANICIVTPAFFPDKGGVEKHVLKSSKDILNDGHCLNIITKQPRNSTESNFEIIDGLNVYRVPWISNKYLRYLFIWFYSVRYLRIFMKMDVIHFHDFQPLLLWFFPWYFVWKMMGKRVCITFHGWEGVCPPQKSIIYMRRLVNKMVHKSLAIGHFIEKWYGTKVDYISYGAADMKANVGCLERSGNYVYVGRLEEDTGILAYLDAWTSFSKKQNGKCLVILGDGSLRSVVEQKVTLDTSIILKGFVDDVESHLLSADVILTSGYLGIIEALQMGKRVISFYDNDLKKDYLCGFPDQDHISICKNTLEIENALNDCAHGDIEFDNIKYVNTYSWHNQKCQYYKMWEL